MAYLLGIDIGTSACKLALFDEGGGLLVQTSREYPVYYPQPGWAEQDAQAWWAAVCAACQALLARAGIRPADIAGVGIDGQSWSAIAVDKQGAVLTRTPIWTDTRARAICEDWQRNVGEDAVFALCGNPLQPTYTLPKIVWYRHCLPDVYRRAYKMLQSNGFIAYRLTGALSHDLSQGYGLHCFDMRKGRWDADMCRALGADPALLPDLFPSHAVVGHVTPQAAALTGLAAGTPVVAGGLDAACGALGAGVVRAGETQEQGGQAGGMSICMDTCVADRRLILGMHVAPGLWLLQGGSVGGGVLRWLREQVCPELSFAQMSDLAATVPPGSDGLVCLPYMAGERSPIWDPRAKGVFFGLDYTKTRAHLIRACMESVAYALRHNLEVAREAGAIPVTLRAMGGAANSRVWTQIKADITGKRIVVPASDTATTW
ncbi:MAG: carbohydrate kinase, partial [Oscillospiraceae bacterium]|nr:carbohydrate kinase [Oscillospiraceae bacterium]